MSHGQKGIRKFHVSESRLSPDAFRWLVAYRASQGLQATIKLLRCSEETLAKILDVGVTARARDRIEAKILEVMASERAQTARAS